MSDDLIPLSQIAEITGGFAFKSDDFGSLGFPVVKIANIEPPRVNLVNGQRIPPDKVIGLDRFCLQDRDIVIAMTGATIGKAGRIRSSEPAYLNQRVAKLAAKAGREFDDYIFALVTREGFDVEVINNSNGSAQANISTDGIGRILVPDLSPAEQLQIGRVIGTIDDKIESNRRMNETLEALAQTIFKEWFVDAAATKLPKGWKIRALYDCADYINGAAFRNEHFSADRRGLPVIKIGELKDGITAQTKFCEIERESKYRIASGDILFSWSGSPDTSIDTFVWCGGDGWLNQHIFKVQFRRTIEKYYVYNLLRHLKPEFIEVARNKQTTGLGHITAQDLKRMTTAFPTDDILEKFNQVAQPLFQRVYSNLCESRILAALRDTLLPKLLSGELRVKTKAI